MTALFVNACVREESRTEILARYFLKQWKENFTEICLAAENIRGLDKKTLKKRDQALAEKDYADPVLKYAVQFAQADTIVIAAPYWDLSFPAQLKDYIERINAVGVTFDYDAYGIPFGMCQAKRLIYITTAGGKAESLSFGYGYVSELCHSFWQIGETVSFIAEGLDLPDADVAAILKETENTMDEWIKAQM